MPTATRGIEIQTQMQTRELLTELRTNAHRRHEQALQVAPEQSHPRTRLRVEVFRGPGPRVTNSLLDATENERLKDG